MLLWTVALPAKTTIAVTPIPNLLGIDQDTRGAYNDLLDNITDIDVVFLSPARIEVEFRKPYVNCLFPGSTETMVGEGELIQSETVQRIQAFIFAQGQKLNLQELRDKNVAKRRGFTFGGKLNALDANIIELNTDLDTAQFLQRNRVDALIGYLPDVRSAFAELALPMPAYDPEQPVYTAIEAFVCHKNADNTAFLQRIRPVIQSWQQSYSPSKVMPEPQGKR